MMSACVFFFARYFLVCVPTDLPSRRRRIGLRRPENARAVLASAVKPVLERLELEQVRSPSGGKGAKSASAATAAVATGGADGPPPPSPNTAAFGPGGAAGAESACSVLVELSEIPGVFATAVSALLAGKKRHAALVEQNRAELAEQRTAGDM